MKDRIETIIRDWLNATFNNPNAIPNLMVKGLAEEIDKHRWEIYENVREEYDLEDIETVADSEGVQLTKEEESLALHRYRKAEDSNLDTLYYIVDEIIENRKKREESLSSLLSNSTQTKERS